MLIQLFLITMVMVNFTIRPAFSAELDEAVTGVSDTCKAKAAEIWREPVVTLEQQSAILKKYPFQKMLESGVSREALIQALVFFDHHNEKIPNKKVLVVIDLTIYAGLPRFFRFKMEDGSWRVFHTAHGRGSDPERTGFAHYFSNDFETQMTPVGFFLTGETYSGSKGLSLKLDGLSMTNFTARRRCIVIHKAKYVGPGLLGRSLGCPAVPTDIGNDLIHRIKDGSLMLIWAGEVAPIYNSKLNTLFNWNMKSKVIEEKVESPQTIPMRFRGR